MREKEARRCFPISPPLPISPQPSQNPPCPPSPKATFLKSPLTKAFFNHILSARLKSFKQLFFQPLTPLHYHHPITLSPPSRRLWKSHCLTHFKQPHMMALHSAQPSHPLSTNLTLHNCHLTRSANIEALCVC